MPEKKYLYGASVIIVEGIMALQSPEMRALYDLKVFVVRPSSDYTGNSADATEL
jgi:uridine kinase